MCQTFCCFSTALMWNLIDSDLPHLIQTNYFTSVNSEKLYILKRNIKTVSDQATQRYLDMRPTIQLVYS
ncbi:3853_t:CDS:2 [Funneliformis geosporum]|nr:3853_t:CDS:2 [Funneliformis geosporum]